MSIVLLYQIFGMWLTVQGFSPWMEYYKQSKRVTTEGKCTLRKLN